MNNFHSQAFDKINSHPDVVVEGCHYELIGEDRYQDMLEFYRVHFCPDEPINRSLQIPWDEENIASFLESFAHNLTIALVLDDTSEIIGGRILIIANKNDKIDTTKYKSEKFKTLMDLTYHFGTMCDMFVHYHVEDMIHFFGLGVHREYRRKGIALKLQKAAVEFVRNMDIGPVLIRGEASSNYSQRIYEKLQFECLATIVFDEYKVNGEVVLKNMGENKTYKLYGKIVSN